MKPLILPEGPLTFADYFKLSARIQDVLDVFGYSYRMESSRLPRQPLENGGLAAVKQNLERGLPHVNLINEVARREFMIAPVLMQIAIYTGAEISVEYPLEVSEKLKGTLDYLVSAKHRLLVIEAKNGDLKKGFTQMAMELVALDAWDDSPDEPRLYGAVSMGDVWKFGFLDRAEKRITEDLNSFSVPTDIDEVGAIIAGILSE